LVNKLFKSILEIFQIIRGQIGKISPLVGSRFAFKPYCQERN